MWMIDDRRTTTLALAVGDIKEHAANGYDFRVESLETDHCIRTIFVESDLGIVMFHTKKKLRPGKPLLWVDAPLEWFKRALEDLYNDEAIRSIAFPYLIGCGTDPGHWYLYYSALETFAKMMALEGRKVVLVFDQ